MYLTAPVPGYGREAFFWPKTSSYRQIFFLYKTVAEKCQFSAGGGWC